MGKTSEKVMAGFFPHLMKITNPELQEAPRTSNLETWRKFN